MCIDTLGNNILSGEILPYLVKTSLKQGKVSTGHHQMSFRWWPNRGTGKPPPNVVSAVAAKLGTNTSATAE